MKESYDSGDEVDNEILEEERIAYTRRKVNNMAEQYRQEAMQIIEVLEKQALAKLLKPYAQKRVETAVKLYGLEDFIIKPERKNKPSDKEKEDSIYWLTISFKDDINFNDLFDFVKHKFVFYEYIENTNWALTFEQRSETKGEYFGIHMHCVFNRKSGHTNYRRSQLIRRIADNFKNYIAGTNFVDLKQYPKRFYEDKIQYMLGNKNDPLKQPKSQNDLNFRQFYKIENIYRESDSSFFN